MSLKLSILMIILLLKEFLCPSVYHTYATQLTNFSKPSHLLCKAELAPTNSISMKNSFTLHIFRFLATEYLDPEILQVVQVFFNSSNERFSFIFNYTFLNPPFVLSPDTKYFLSEVLQKHNTLNRVGLM